MKSNKNKETIGFDVFKKWFYGKKGWKYRVFLDLQQNIKKLTLQTQNWKQSSIKALILLVMFLTIQRMGRSSS